MMKYLGHFALPFTASMRSFSPSNPEHSLLSPCNAYLQLCPCRLQPGWRQANGVPCGLGTLLNAASYLLQSVHVRIQVQRGGCLHLQIIVLTFTSDAC